MSTFTFWNDQTDTLNSAEYKKWRAQSGARLVEFAVKIADRAKADLPVGMASITLPPELMAHVEHDHIALGILFDIAQQIPIHNPLPDDSTAGQCRAWRVLEALRATVMAARNIPAGQALDLIEATLALGIAASRAHVEPWERTVDGRLRSMSGLYDLNRPADTEDTYNRWQQAANATWAEQPELSKSAVARIIADDKRLPGGNVDTIRKKIRKP